MSSATPNISPEIQRSIDMWRDVVPADPTVENWRVAIDAMMNAFPIPDEAEFEHIDANGVPVISVSVPGAARDQVIVHFHSGGYVMGSAEGYREFAYRLAKATGRRVFVVDYRLAPENPYPAPVEDARTVYEWLLQTHQPNQVILHGDSAGGGLCIALIHQLKDDGRPLPLGVSIISPLLDLAAEGDSYDEFSDSDPVITRELAVGMGVVYIGDRDPKKTPLASPLYGTFNEFPPLLSQVGAHEAIRDDSTRLVRKIQQEGGAAEVITYPHVPHVFPIFPFLGEGAEAFAKTASFIDRLSGESDRN